MKTIFFTLAICHLALGAQAQQTAGGATQTTSLTMADAIEITMQNSAPTVNLVFADVNDYANGVISVQQTILVRSNRKFNVRVKSQSSKFSYNGTGGNPNMPSSVLKLKVTSNNTGGTIGSGFSQFKSMSTGSKKLINNATPGGDNTFSIQYQATPGFTYPDGEYSLNIIYTATQS